MIDVQVGQEIPVARRFQAMSSKPVSHSLRHPRSAEGVLSDEPGSLERLFQLAKLREAMRELGDALCRLASESDGESEPVLEIGELRPVREPIQVQALEPEEKPWKRFREASLEVVERKRVEENLGRVARRPSTLAVGEGRVLEPRQVVRESLVVFLRDLSGRRPDGQL